MRAGPSLPAVQSPTDDTAPPPGTPATETLKKGLRNLIEMCDDLSNSLDNAVSTFEAK